MCVMCLEIIKGNMTLAEVDRARGEFSPPSGHEEELEAVIEKAFPGVVVRLPTGNLGDALDRALSQMNYEGGL